MDTVVKILIVDDHPAIIEGYKSIFSSSGRQVSIDAVHDCEAAYKTLTSKAKSYDVALLDVLLPPYEAQQLLSGEDLALVVQQQMRGCKIIMLTSHADSFTLYNLIKKVDPNGLLVKSDFKPDELLLAFQKVLEGKTYYSVTAQQSLKTLQAKEVYLDNCNRRIISLIAKGIKTKNLPAHLGLSISAIDKRKAQIREIFDIAKGTDEDIIREARRSGFI